MGSLHVIELQLVAFVMVFSASGLVPVLDLLFPAFASAYLLALSRLAWPSAGEPENLPEGSVAYVVLGTTVGLFLPLAYVLGGFARGDEQAVRSATPHLFLLSFQILTQNLTDGLPMFSPPVKAMVPLIYTVRRIFVTVDWICDLWRSATSLPSTAPVKDVVWIWFGKGLAVANLIYFSFSLFAFLIPCFLPTAFERYFKQRDEVAVPATKGRDKKTSFSPEPKSVETKKGD